MTETEEPAGAPTHWATETKPETEKHWWETLVLPKWSALVVSGEPIDEEQALEVIVRTDGLYWIGNDTSMAREMYKALGVGVGDHGWPITEELDKLRKEIKVIDHLQIVSEGSMSQPEFEATVHDLVNFLVYVGEPIKMSRPFWGVFVWLFLFVFLYFAYQLKKEYWKDIE